MTNLERAGNQEVQRTLCLTYIRTAARNYAHHQSNDGQINFAYHQSDDGQRNYAHHQSDDGQINYAHHKSDDGLRNYAHHQRDDGQQMLSKVSIESLLKETEVCDHVFKLFDEEGRGELVREDWLEGMRRSGACFNERLSEKIGELVRLLENTSSDLEVIDKEAFGEIWRAEGVLDNAMEVVKYFAKTKEDSVSINSLMQFIMIITKKNVGAGLSDEHIARLRTVFEKEVGEGGLLTLAQFKKIVPSKNAFFVERIFSIFDTDGSGTVCLTKFLEGISQFSLESDEQKIRFLFKVYDSKNDGKIDEEEMREMMVGCMKENGMDFDDRVIGELANALYEDAAKDGSDGVTIDDLMEQLRRHEGLLKNLTINIGKLLVPIQPQLPRSTKRAISTRIPQAITMNHWRERKSFLLFLVFIFIVNSVLFVHRTVYFKDFSNLDGSTPNVFYMMSRGCGRLLLFNSVLVLVLVLRNSLTVLRNLGFGIFLPIDHHIFIHKVTGWSICCLSWVHTIMHLCNFAINIQPNPVRFVQLTSKYWQEYFRDNSSFGYIQKLGYNVPDGCSLVVTNTSVNFPELTLTSFFSNIHDGTHNNSCPEEDQDKPLAFCQSCPEDSIGPWNFMDFIITTRPGLFGMSGGIANPTGVALIIIISAMTFFSLPFVRRSGFFQVFYITHMLYFFYWALLLIHAPQFWKWFIFPGVLFAIEILHRTITSLINRGKTVICAGVLLPSKVTQLIIRRPPGFSFSPGDWVFVRIPELTSSEWHPFTISSAPEVPGTFTLHIRGVGAWTNNLHQYFEHKYREQRYGEKPKESFDLGKSIRRRVTTLKKSLTKKSTPVDNKNIAKRKDHSDPGPNHICWQEKYPFNKEKQEERMNSRRNNLLKRSMSHPISDLEKSEAEQSNLRTIKSIRYLRTTPDIVTFDIEEDSNENIELEDVVTNNTEDRYKDSGRRTDLNRPLEIHIDGPFGSPSSDIYRANHAVLIATGIGVTPYASILQSIMHKFLNTKTTCPNCEFQWTDLTFSNEMYNLKKVDFFWINRDQKSFEWFVKLLSQLEIEQAEQGGEMDRFLDMHMYITSALKKTDMKAVGLQLALDLLHLKQKRDLVTGLKARTNAGRPDWDAVFSKIQQERRGQVSVFYCGNAALSKTLKIKCAEYGFKFKKEVF